MTSTSLRGRNLRKKKCRCALKKRPKQLPMPKNRPLHRYRRHRNLLLKDSIMAGHSHWARIKRKKGVTDARRGRLWSKLARNVIVAARTGGGDPSANLSLRYAIDKCKAANMPKDTIENAVKKGSGGLEGVNYETVYYEGYAPGGIAVLVEALTDNRNRTAPEIKKIFERSGSNVAAAGAVKWMFSSKGQISIPVAAAD